jgi:hypothetical protein
VVRACPSIPNLDEGLLSHRSRDVRGRLGIIA